MGLENSQRFWYYSMVFRFKYLMRIMGPAFAAADMNTLGGEDSPGQGYLELVLARSLPSQDDDSSA